ncbi:uncharacterized protein LOC114331395 [Diabrotica virgifera virgifera]|uniref:Uncharacterized protein LOC114331395 n=1 Tax=Diabrotica virgifera virgifera TaxID=50390 RepID=A0A6P7FVL8_DIAVI|nr:uncharacterized protein LOC114331395 [Diabrotica virgifera virgifera]
MRGPYKGVDARIVEESSTAMYIHCNVLILNLYIVSCCSIITSIRNTFLALQSIYHFIGRPRKRHSIFEKIQASLKGFAGGTMTLKSLSDTRWACRVEAVRSLLDNFEATISTIQEIENTDPDTGGQASPLLKSMEDFNFVFNLLLLKQVLLQCDLLSKTLQSVSLTFDLLKSVKNSTIEIIQSYRTDQYFDKLFDYCSKITEKCGFRPAKLPRRGKIPAKLVGGSKAPFEAVKEHLKATVFSPLLDTLEQEIENRLQDNNLDVLNHLSQLLGRHEVVEESIKFVSKYYSLDEELLFCEMKIFHNMKE